MVGSNHTLEGTAHHAIRDSHDARWLTDAIRHRAILTRGTRGRAGSAPFGAFWTGARIFGVDGEQFIPMSLGQSTQTTRSPAGRTSAVLTLSLVVAVVLGDSGVVTLALPEILRDFDAAVGQVAWVLIAFNLVLALVAVPAARVCVRRDPAATTTVGLIVFAAATTVCAAAPSLVVLIAARAVQAVGGAMVIVGSLELLAKAAVDERAGVQRWTAAGIAGAALGPVAGGLLTSAFSWRAIFVAQIPVVLLALPTAIAMRERRGRGVVRNPDTPPDRPLVLANLALALLSAALTAALFLLVLLLVDGWRHSPAVAAVVVTAVPAAALAARPLFRGMRAGTRSEAIAGSVLIAGGLVALALLPSARLAWTIAPQVLVGLGLGLAIDSLTAAALRDRVPRALHGGWTIASRHAGVVVGLAILTPIFTADLSHAETPAKEAIASLVLDAQLPASTKLDLADRLGSRLSAESGRVPDLRPAFNDLRLPAAQATTARSLELALDDKLKRAATRAFRNAFLVAALLALLALGPALALRDRSRS